MTNLVNFYADFIYYWDAWHDGSKVMLHFGKVGDLGAAEIISCKTNKEAEATIQRLANEKKASGYMKPDDDLYSVLIIQYAIDGFGDEATLDKRYAIQDLMDKMLRWTGNGSCDGGDIGADTMNIVCMVLDIRAALNTMIEALAKHHYLEGAVIALETEDRDEVLYPDNSDAASV